MSKEADKLKRQLIIEYSSNKKTLTDILQEYADKQNNKMETRGIVVQQQHDLLKMENKHLKSKLKEAEEYEIIKQGDGFVYSACKYCNSEL